MDEIWAVLEYNNSTFQEHRGELLSELVDIAVRQPEPARVCAVILCSPQAELPDLKLLSHIGVQQLYVLEHAHLVRYSTEGYISALAWLIKQREPVLVATSASLNGRDWMPRLASRLHLLYVPNCLSLVVQNYALFAIRSIYEGRAYVQTRTTLNGRTALATLVPGIRGRPVSEQRSSTKFNHDEVNRFTITRLTPEIQISGGQERVHHVTVQVPSSEEIELDAAERIVAGGRGIGQSGFATLASFAHRVNASLGATRVATDLGWIEHSRQIGSTGKIVHPKLYIACGISGAAQHTSGMTESQVIVAINPDRSAPIFALADLGLLGDANEILPLATEMLEEYENHNAKNAAV
jgi:electron transfer flavoprotein alpha subunit